MLGGTAADQHQARSAPSQRSGGRPPDAAGGTGDDSHPAFEAFQRPRRHAPAGGRPTWGNRSSKPSHMGCWLKNSFMRSPTKIALALPRADHFART